jgi:predicted dehydrogenase
MQKRVRIGFVGVGAMGQCAHLRNYVALAEDCEVVALAELKMDQGQKVARHYNVPRVYTDHEEMMSKEDLDGVVASQPFDRHGIVVTSLAKHGIPIFTEKPLAASLQVGKQIVDALREHDCKHMVGYHKRSDPATAYVRGVLEELKSSGELGKLTYVRILMPAGDWIAGGFDGLIAGDDPQPNLEFDPPPPDMDEDTFGKHNAFVNYYIHQVNLMRYLLGEPYEVTHADGAGILLVAESESGISCTIEMTPYRTTMDWQESAFVAFEKGYVKMDLPPPLAVNEAGKVEVFRDPGETEPVVTVPRLPAVHAMRMQAVNFIKFVRGTSPAPCDAQEALEDLKVARDYIRLWTGK